MTNEVFANSPTPGSVAPVAVLAGNGGQINATVTSFSIAVALPSHLQSGGQFHAIIDHEVMIIPTQTGTSLTGVTRAASPESVAAVHLDGASIYPLLTAEALQNALSAVQAAAEAASASASALSAESTRAQTAESTNASAITAETTRAQGVEGTNATAISTETTRAEGVEATKAAASDLTSEVTRAEAAEATKATSSALSAEMARAEAAEATMVPASQLGAANGVATLTGTTLTPSQVPSSVVNRTWLPINVMDPQYGAVGDGITDDTTAVQAALTAAATAYATTGSITDVVFPSGYHFKFGQITIGSGTRIWAYGAAITPKGTFSGFFFKFPPGTQYLQSFEIRGGTFIGLGTESANFNNQILGNATNSGMNDVLVRDIYVTNWGSTAFYFRNPTRVRFLNNTIICNEIGNAPAFQNTVTFDFDGGAPCSGRIFADGNFIHNATADSISVVVLSTAAPVPLYFTVTNNIVTADPPTADTGCTFNATATVADTAASTANVNKWVVGPGLASPVYIVSAVNGVSYTLSKTSSFTGTGTLYVGVYRGSIVTELDSSSGASDIIFANNNVTGYERACVSISGSGQNVTKSIIKGNIIHNGQVGATWTSGSPQGSGISLNGNNADVFDVAVEGNRVDCASSVPPISLQIGTNNGRQTGNKFTTGPASGTATLVAGTITVSTTEIQTGDVVALWRQAAGGALGDLSLGTITAGTSFVINSSSATETSTVYWEIKH